MTDVTDAAAAVPVPDGFDFTDPDLYAARVPFAELAELAELRRTAPVFWNPRTREESGFDDGGFRVVSRHEDVRALVRRGRLVVRGEHRHRAVRRGGGRR